MQGLFESREGGEVVARETWSIAADGALRGLTAKGSDTGDLGRTWSLGARFGAQGDLDALEVQVRPTARPAEVTTTALRCFGGRAYGTTIPPEGVPHKFECAFEPGAAVRGYSTALSGFTAGWRGLKVGHGRRLLVVELETPDLRPRVDDAMLLARGKQRAKGPSVDEWCVVFEFRWAQSPGRTVAASLVTKRGVVLREEHPLRSPARTTELVSFTN